MSRREPQSIKYHHYHNMCWTFLVKLTFYCILLVTVMVHLSGAISCLRFKMLLYKPL